MSISIRSSEKLWWNSLVSTMVNVRVRVSHRWICLNIWTPFKPRRLHVWLKAEWKTIISRVFLSFFVKQKVKLGQVSLLHPSGPQYQFQGGMSSSAPTEVLVPPSRERKPCRIGSAVGSVKEVHGLRWIPPGPSGSSGVVLPSAQTACWWMKQGWFRNCGKSGTTSRSVLKDGLSEKLLH